jgi:hypothetical protein
MEKPANLACLVAVIYRWRFRKRPLTNCAEPVLLGLEDFEIALRDLIAAGLWRLPGDHSLQTPEFWRRRLLVPNPAPASAAGRLPRSPKRKSDGRSRPLPRRPPTHHLVGHSGRSSQPGSTRVSVRAASAPRSRRGCHRARGRQGQALRVAARSGHP